ncbi:MAG TPA: hypothetical protein VNZ64_07795 [Candidatus Acidoferrum sp.]|jgi:hypothetical protein|nr:hypothetical protein [Candidatus Acidoferrum sp.]
MHSGVFVLLATLLLAPGCSTSHSAKARAAAPPPPSPEPYVRIDNADSNLIQLQIAVRKFVPARHKGPTLWLAGVSHLGESNYYAVLQKHLDAQTLVLFEGVAGPSDEATDAKPGAASPPASGPRAAASAASGSASSLQSSMAAALGLVFQLEAIDYRRPNFRHCDLSVGQIRDLIAEQPPAPGQPGAGPSFEGLLEMMQGGSWLDSLVQLGLRVIGANPKLQGLAKLALIDTICEIQGDPSRLEGLPPEMKQLLDVLLQKRNQKVIADLKTEMKKLGRRDSVAVFYGTGHMPDLERRVRRELDYRPSGQLWLTAFSVNLAKTRITGPERAFLHDLLKHQLEQLQAQPKQ